MDIVGILINLVSGGIGGNAAGAALKDKSLGSIGNTIAGALGGSAGVWILNAVGVLSSLGINNFSDIGALLGTVGTSAVSGGLVTAIIGMIKSKMG
jgi:uncharacterized membrane protein YeaQ/YmgE (transglycosylase-associated protein family)